MCSFILNHNSHSQESREISIFVNREAYSAACVISETVDLLDILDELAKVLRRCKSVLKSRSVRERANLALYDAFAVGM